jgi:uncharacterized protein
MLRSAGFDTKEVDRIEEMILEAHTATRTSEISLEGSALSDADTLFKALPMTLVVFSHLFLEETESACARSARRSSANSYRWSTAGSMSIFDLRLRE